MVDFKNPIQVGGRHTNLVLLGIDCYVLLQKEYCLPDAKITLKSQKRSMFVNIPLKWKCLKLLLQIFLQWQHKPEYKNMVL